MRRVKASSELLDQTLKQPRIFLKKKLLTDKYKVCFLMGLTGKYSLETRQKKRQCKQLQSLFRIMTQIKVWLRTKTKLDSRCSGREIKSKRQRWRWFLDNSKAMEVNSIKKKSSPFGGSMIRPMSLINLPKVGSRIYLMRLISSSTP